MRSYAILAIVTFACVSLIAAHLSAQGYYSRTVVRNPVTGRQQIVNYQHPRWTSHGQGGLMVDGASGSLQRTAVRRSRFTGRLEYHNQFFNPWTGASYTTDTTFNPFTGRYETLHNLVPPPQNEDPAVAAADKPRPRRGIRVIETKLEIDDEPAEVAPPLELTEEVTQSPSEADVPQTTIEIRQPN